MTLCMFALFYMYSTVTESFSRCSVRTVIRALGSSIATTLFLLYIAHWICGDIPPYLDVLTTTFSVNIFTIFWCTVSTKNHADAVYDEIFVFAVYEAYNILLVLWDYFRKSWMWAAWLCTMSCICSIQSLRRG